MIAAMQQEILTNLQVMNSAQVAEVLDFVEFLRYRPHKHLPDVRSIDALCGKYKQRLSSSQEFAHQKSAEIQSEEAKWRKR